MWKTFKLQFRRSAMQNRAVFVPYGCLTLNPVSRQELWIQLLAMLLQAVKYRAKTLNC